MSVLSLWMGAVSHELRRGTLAPFVSQRPEVPSPAIIKRKLVFSTIHSFIHQQNFLGTYSTSCPELHSRDSKMMKSLATLKKLQNLKRDFFKAV